MPLVYLTSVDVAYGIHSFSSTTAQYIQLGALVLRVSICFSLDTPGSTQALPGMPSGAVSSGPRWRSSRNFLAWNGTELICAGGHGLLHIPELPTSWFSTQRWLYLDASWGSLFSDAYMPSAGVV